ncbi:aspartic protease [Aphelenchoides avenae]|nr:aspartic protease [Aphelenchus avenae]
MSATLNVTKQTDFVCSGPGCVGGRLAVDVFSTGDVQVENMTALLVDAMRHDRGNVLPSIPIDGVFGAWMGQSAMQRVLRQINRHLFTIALSGHVGQKAGSGGGFITYGALDDVNCASDWTYVDVDAPSPISDQWNVVVDGVTYGSYKAYENWQVHAALSTGIPRLQLPVGLVDKIATDATGKFDQDLLVYVVDCDVAGLPDIVFIIGGHKYPIPWKDYILDVEHEPGKCVLNLDATWGVINIGDPFYRTFCTSYDYAQKRVGFAKSLI